MRARVFYYHQIGYYALGIKQTTAERKRMLPLYLRILVGTEHFPMPHVAGARSATSGRLSAARAITR